MFKPSESITKEINQLQKEMQAGALKGETYTIVDNDLLTQLIASAFSCLGTNQQLEMNRARTIEELATLVEAMAGKKSKEFAMEVASKMRKVQ